MREKGRCFRLARGTVKNGERRIGRIKSDKNLLCPGCAGGERGKRIAEFACSVGTILGARMAVANVDQAAVTVDVLERMQQRALPRSKQRDGKKDAD